MVSLPLVAAATLTHVLLGVQVLCVNFEQQVGQLAGLLAQSDLITEQSHLNGRALRNAPVVGDGLMNADSQTVTPLADPQAYAHDVTSKGIYTNHPL